MSSGAQVAVLGVPGRRLGDDAASLPARPQITRLIAFGALGLYGTARWSKLLAGGSHGRLIAMFALALLLAGGRPVLARRSRPLAAAFTALILVAALPLAGLPIAWLWHVRIAVMARAVGHGLGALPKVLVPYTGTDRWVRLDVVLGGAVLLFDAALLLAFAPPRMDDMRRAGATLPLVALVAVPSTLAHPRFAYLNGLLLFLLLAAFVLADRVNNRQAGSALGLTLLAAIGAMLIAPGLAQRTPWLNYEALAGGVAPRTVEVFDWNQTYGPVDWPRRDHTVLEISARQPEYWKAENLDVFDGHGWTQGSVPGQETTPAPSSAAQAAWTQTIQVTVRDMRSADVIGAGLSGQPSRLSQFALGYTPGTWTTGTGPLLKSGDTYTVPAYAPQPTAAELSAAGTDYTGLAPGYRTILVPARPGGDASPQIAFPPFHSASAVQDVIGLPVSLGASIVRSSIYGPAYRLALRLARSSPTPYAFAEAVQRFLSHGYTYTQDPPVRPDPLESFLFTDKRGYCQQFAGAMALLLRMGGVPARVAVGFTQGRQDPTNQHWLVSDLDAHAWVELWFPHYGWVKFDPTPRVDPALRNLAPVPAAALSLSNAGQLQNNRNGALKLTSRSHTGGAHRAHGHSNTGAWEGIAAGSAALLAALVLTWLTTRPLGSTEELVRELERALARTGQPLAPHDTLAGLEQKLPSAPAARDYVRVLRQARFGAEAGRPTSAQRRALRRHLGFRTGPVGKLRAVWALPPRRHPPTRARGLRDA